MNLEKMEMNRKWAWESSQGIVKVNLFFVFYSKEDEITKWRKSFLRKRTQAKARIVRYYKTHLQDENEQRKTNKENMKRRIQQNEHNLLINEKGYN